MSATSKPILEHARDFSAWVCWIGHSTVLIRLNEKWILTDPLLFSNYGIQAFGMTLGPRRISNPALHIEQIPKPDLVLLSHAHMDHMDRKTLKALTELYPGKLNAITASNTSDIIDDLPWGSLNEMDWGENSTVNGLSIRALKVKHNGWRMPGEACRAAGQRRTGRSYNGYEIESGGIRIVFGGDTAYTTDFTNVRGPVDIAIMPIGAYDPYPETHCTPEESLAMVEMMKARYMVPIHHATFCQSQEPMSEPMQRLYKAIRRSSSQLALQEVGGTLGLPLV
ncbi:MAG: MBL fold metallo-hydrolase [bacterium]|nr:MBL fold metallo-hydrolase [bacterium]